MLQPNTLTINGDFKVTAMHEIPNNAPHNIVEKDTPFHVHVEIDLNGQLAVLSGDNITYDVMFESIGTGFEGKIASKTDTFPILGTSYQKSVWVPCGKPVDLGLDEGVYKMVVVATVRSTLGNIVGIAGFSEGPLVQVYEDPAVI